MPCRSFIFCSVTIVFMSIGPAWLIAFADDSGTPTTATDTPAPAKRGVRAQDDAKKVSSAERQQLVEVVTAAFREVHEGWSTDG
jgi:hypothetical protein